MAIRKFVLLVAGHDIDGDPGAVAQGTKESVEAVQITDRVYDLLSSHPNIVVERVPHNLDFVDSTTWANNLYKNLEDGIVVEIHKNAFNHSASGNEVLIPAGADATSKKIAQSIQNELTAQTGLPNRGVKERGDLYLIREVNMYAVLVEAGFIDKDPVSDEFDAKYAAAIANGICDFFGEARPNAPKPAPLPAPAPAPKPAAKVLFHVIVDGKQIGAYGIEQNAYNKWVDGGRKGVIRDGAGNDVTAALNGKYAPSPPTPAAQYVSAGKLDGVEYFKKK